MSDAFVGARLTYSMGSLDESEVAESPIAQLQSWVQFAVEEQLLEPTAMTVCTVDAQGGPHARTVLLREVNEVGLRFYTNLRSAKAQELEGNPRCAAHLLWLDLQRQVRIEGFVRSVPDADADAYFATRPRGSQLGAWSSPQSEPVDGRPELEALFAETEQRFANSSTIPRPAGWGGFELMPESMEFWQGRPNRMHDRLRYRRVDDRWALDRLAP